MLFIGFTAIMLGDLVVTGLLVFATGFGFSGEAFGFAGCIRLVEELEFETEFEILTSALTVEERVGASDEATFSVAAGDAVSTGLWLSTATFAGAEFVLLTFSSGGDGREGCRR